VAVSSEGARTRRAPRNQPLLRERSAATEIFSPRFEPFLLTQRWQTVTAGSPQ
jgi:hypothetical protein